MIPVAPGAHYSCGGILADLDGRTTLPGLYAAGEAASTGVQGANRLASNSVTEALIAGRRTGEAIAAAVAPDGCDNHPAIGGSLPQPSGWTTRRGQRGGGAAAAAAAGSGGCARARRRPWFRPPEGGMRTIRAMEPARGGTSRRPCRGGPG